MTANAPHVVAAAPLITETRAAVMEGPDRLTVRAVPFPPMGEYDALCELLYGAICAGTDHHLLSGRAAHWAGIRYPSVLGHESIGRVIATGPKVRYLKVGDLVTRVGTRPAGGVNINWGGFSEYGLAADHRAMAEDGLPRTAWDGYRVNQVLPPGTDPAEATMMITWRETLSYITRLGVGPGSRVLVIGSGGNGLSFVAHAANLGAAQVTLLGSAGRAALGRAAGASACLDYRAPDLAARLAETAGAAGLDFVIDAVGQNGNLDRALPHLKPGGTVGIYGMDDFGRYTLSPQSARGTFTYYAGGYDEAETHERVLAFWKAGRLRPELWLDLDHIFPLDQVGAALASVAERRAVKTVVRLHA